MQIFAYIITPNQEKTKILKLQHVCKKVSNNTVFIIILYKTVLTFAPLIVIISTARAFERENGWVGENGNDTASATGPTDAFLTKKKKMEREIPSISLPSFLQFAQPYPF